MSATRRHFLPAATAVSYGRILGANDRGQVGFEGYGLIGAQHVFDFKNQKDVDMAAMSDVYQPRLEQGVAACGGNAKPYEDFRKLLDNKEIQAVVVAKTLRQVREKKQKLPVITGLDHVAQLQVEQRT